MATEPHFLDHLAPVWRALRNRGTFLVPPSLAERAVARGVEVEIAPGLDGPSVGMAAVDCPDAPILVASYGDVKRARARGRTRIAFIEHGIGQSYQADSAAARNGSYAGGTDREDVGLFIVPNEHAAARWRAAYPAARVEIVGCPKLDGLPRREAGPGPVVALSFHWPCSAAPETHPAYGHFASVLPTIARRFRVIGHAHPRYWQIARTYARMGIEYVPDFDEVCRRADIYVCDNSSTLYEFAATGRPVVVLNSPEYRRHLSHGLRFWDAADVGIQVNEPAELGPAIAEALEDAPARVSARNAALDLVYAHRSGAAERAAAALEAWAAGQKVRVAA